jgi:hypothetical protein
MAKTAASITRPSTRRVWGGPAKAAPMPAKDRLVNWYMQTMRNMQAIGYGHQRGMPCVVLPDGSARVLDLGEDALCEHLGELVDKHGAEGIKGVGYVYWNDTPEDLLKRA